MIKLINLLKETKVAQPGMVGASFLNWVIKNKQEIANINPNFTEIIMNNDGSLLDSSFWTEDDYYSAYEEYSYTDFMEDWKKYKGSIVMLGEELSSVFIYAIDLPMPFINVATGNDSTFFGSRPNERKASKKYKVNGVNLYIVFGINDPGS